MGRRISSTELSFVIAAITIQREVGGSLANFFQLISEVVRERHQFRLRVRALTSTGRASANVLMVMPFAIGLLLTAVNPTYMHPLYHTTAGHILLGIALGMLAVGALIMRKIAAFQA